VRRQCSTLFMTRQSSVTFSATPVHDQTVQCYVQCNTCTWPVSAVLRSVQHLYMTSQCSVTFTDTSRSNFQTFPSSDEFSAPERAGSQLLASYTSLTAPVLLHIREVPGSNRRSPTDWPDCFFQAYTGIVPDFGHDCFLLHTIQFYVFCTVNCDTSI
jgi:hypothetical protein